MSYSRKEVINKLSQLLPDLKQEYAVSSLGLFGSFARDEQSDNSDLDVLVEFNQPIGLKFFELKMYLEKVFNNRVDLVTKKALKPRLAPIILTEVIDIE